jgi:hypothetical protein
VIGRDAAKLITYVSGDWDGKAFHPGVRRIFRYQDVLFFNLRIPRKHCISVVIIGVPLDVNS